MPFRWMPAQGNLLALCGEAALTITPALDTLTPDGQMFDGRPSTPVRFGTKAGQVSIGCTLNLLRNPGFEIEDLSDWTVPYGDSERTTTGGEVGAGTASLKILVGAIMLAGEGVCYQDVSIPSGIPFRVSALLRGTGVAPATLSVMNQDTGRFSTTPEPGSRTRPCGPSHASRPATLR